MYIEYILTWRCRESELRMEFNRNSFCKYAYVNNQPCSPRQETMLKARKPLQSLVNIYPGWALPVPPAALAVKCRLLTSRLLFLHPMSSEVYQKKDLGQLYAEIQNGFLEQINFIILKKCPFLAFFFKQVL